LIESADNPRYKRWRSLLDSRGIRRHGLALVAGRHTVEEVARDYPNRVDALLTVEGVDAPSVPRAAVHRLAPPLLNALDPGGAGPPLVVVRVPQMPAWRAAAKTPGCTLFLPLQDPSNVGGSLRSAAAFGVRRVVLLREAAHPCHSRSVQAAGSAVFRVPLGTGPPLARLNPAGLPCFVLDVTGRPLSSIRFPERFGLIVGMEGPGARAYSGPGTRVAIPIAPGIDSLNAAAALSIALYEWRRARRRFT